MNQTNISDSVIYVGVNDRTLDLFESQYAIPNGVSYNSYVILDEKNVVMDTVDTRAGEQWLVNLEQVLAGEPVEYLVVSHMEPDHAANLMRFTTLHPEAKIVGNTKTFGMIEQFFDLDLTGRKLVVKEGDTLPIGSHVLQFFMAPMVHWPEVMVTYEQKEKILFSADAFGKFGAVDTEEEWTEEAARYYLNIVGKYGTQVQSLLTKVEKLSIDAICPLHGPVLTDNIAFYLNQYKCWSLYEAEETGVLVAYASIHGNTARIAGEMADLLRNEGVRNVDTIDLTRCDMSVAVRKAFYYDRLIVAAATYDGGIFPPMEDFLHHLKSKNYQKRSVGIIENGSWAPLAAKGMRAILEPMKDLTIGEPVVTIKSTLSPESAAAMQQLAIEMANL